MSDEETKVELDADLEAIFGQLDGLTLGKAAKLVKAMEDRWGVSAAVPAAAVAMGAAGGASDGEAAAEEEQTSFDVVLEGPGEKKIQVIKVVRAHTSLGLKEAKELVDNAPRPVREGLDKEEAEKLKAELEAAGGTVVLK